MRHALLTLLVLLLALPAWAQRDFSQVEIQTIPVSENLYMLVGAGGNIGVSVGDDGAFVIDDQYAPLTDKIVAAIGALTDQPIRFVVNTHWHGDHTGGNENMGARGAIIVAHENVRARMSEEQFLEVFNDRVPPAPPGALPIVTFSDMVTFHWNGDDIEVFHVDPAHTDGDAIIYFPKANAVHMGDTYFNGFYPFIDASTGGSIDGVIEAADIVLDMVDDETKIIPGHGPLSNKAELQAYRDLLDNVRSRMQMLLEEGMTRDEVIATKPTADLDAAWGGGFMQPDVWVGIVFDSMQDE